MQIIDLYIRGVARTSVFNSAPTGTIVIDNGAQFLNGLFEVGQIVKNLTSGVEGRITAINSDVSLSVTSGLFSGSNKPYQIYDDYTKLELFKDESVSITDTIQNVKDPAKIFAPFSQQFSVPASKHNNKFFKHYYSVDINNSFDARFQADALIQLNGVNYKVGKLRLNSVELKEEVAYSYKLVFTGNTVELKEILAENELSSLPIPTGLNYQYDDYYIQQKVLNGAVDADIVFPLIFHSKNMRYNGNGNYKDQISDTFMNGSDIKPALKCRVIIDAIEAKYPQLKFSDEFFNSYQFKKLFIWLHREEGFMTNAIEGGAVQVISTRWNQPENPSNPQDNWEFFSGTRQRPGRCAQPSGGEYYYETEWTVSMPGNQDYEVEIRRASNNDLMFSSSGSGTQTFSDYEFRFADWSYNELDVYFNVITDNTLGITQTLTMTRKFLTNSGTLTTVNTGGYDRGVVASDNEVIISQQLPKMKIIDFLKNLFLMYNLTAYRDGDVLVVLPLDDYYSTGVSYDITRYVDTKKSTISKLSQFKKMKFDFKSKKSYLIQYSDEIQGNKFAQEEYGDDNFDGSTYSIEPNFEKMMYERLTDGETNLLTGIVQGAMLNKKFEPTIGQPLLFYSNRTSTTAGSSATIPWGTGSTLLNSYIRPSNSLINDANQFISDTLNYGVENDEYLNSTGNPYLQPQSNDLFTKYYRNYVASLFAINSRETKVSAYLPLSIILKYKLNDVFIIGHTQYRINSIKTNLLTNKSDLELYNLTTNVQQRLGGQSPSLGRVQGLVATGSTSSGISFSWDLLSAPNLVKFNVYTNDLFTNTSYGSAVTNGGVTGLLNKTTYKITLRAVYTIDGNEVESFDTNIFETTT
tara:strand:- start:351 stop:2933 length:2583 start_codon:yes stop_codon:yes gene_type:complete